MDFANGAFEVCCFFVPLGWLRFGVGHGLSFFDILNR